MSHFSTNVYASTDRNKKFRWYDSVINTFPNSKLIEEREYYPSDLAIIYSWINDKKNGSETDKGKILNYKKHILEEQKRLSKHVMAIDNSLFVYKDQQYIHNYLRYSLDGIFANTGYYFDNNVDKSRWHVIQKNLSIDVKPWRKKGDHILICLQRINGFSFDYEKDLADWLTGTLLKLSRVTDRKIIIRKHPGDNHARPFIRKAISTVNNRSTRSINNKGRSIKNVVTISSNSRIEEDLANAWCCITYNSSPSVVSVIEGVPVFVMDPTPQKSQAYLMCNTDLSMVETPFLPENRQEWLERISMSHFTPEDIRNGLLYRATSEFFESKYGKV